MSQQGLLIPRLLLRHVTKRTTRHTSISSSAAVLVPNTNRGRSVGIVGISSNSLHHPSQRWLYSTTTMTMTLQQSKEQPAATTEDQTKNSTSKKEGSSGKEEEEEDEVPVWQNPLHHNNPDYEKMFPEDYGPDEVMPILPLPPMAQPGSNVEAPPHIHDLADCILALNMLEMRELMNKVATHFGFDAHAIAMQMGGGGGSRTTTGAGQQEDEETAPVVEEKTVFELKLVGFDAKAKIKVIKEVRAIAGLGLKEAKELVEAAPTIIQKDLKREQAEELQKKLEEAGATIEIV